MKNKSKQMETLIKKKTKNGKKGHRSYYYVPNKCVCVYVLVCWRGA